MTQNPTIAQNPNPEELAGYAALFVLAGDVDTYRQQCARVFERLGDTRQAHAAYLVARICALTPDAEIDPNKLVQIAERAVQAKPVPHHLHTLGLAYYRAGQFDKAIEQLQKSMEGNWKAQVVNWLVLAMAHQRLGHADEARIWFEKAVRWIDNSDVAKSPGSSDRLRSLYPHDAVACMVLRREAEMLLWVQPQPAPEDKRPPAEKGNTRSIGLL
jgi:tetratricopeptide (TPR) repeat protein